MSSFMLILILFVFPSIVLLVCGYLHFRNHFKIVIKWRKLFASPDKTNSQSISPSNEAQLNIQSIHNHQDSHLMPSRHPIHVSQSSHLSEMSTFSSSYKEQHRYSCKKIKKCLNSLKIIQSKDNDWNFFPLSFLFYILLLFSLTLIISLKYKYSYSIVNTSCSFTAPLIKTTAIDAIILYCLLMLNIWESLLNFFRYWTTRQCAQLVITNTNTVYIYFSSYLFLFLILCIVQFHFVYYLFSVIIIVHISFNMFCIIQFSHILLKQYNTISEGDRKTLAIVNDNMLLSVKIMMTTSLISCIMNTFILSFTISCYDMDIILYIPLIHCISSFIFSFNFVRNRSSMNHCFIQIQKIPIIKRANDDNINDVTKLRINMHLSPLHQHPNPMITPQPPNTPEISVSNHDEIDETVAPIQEANDDIEAIPDNIVSTPSTSVVVNNNDSPDIAPNTDGPSYISLTPLFRSNILNKNGKTSRSEPSSPLINNLQIQKHKKLSKTPQFAARLGFSQSPVSFTLNPKHWVKTLSLNIGLTANSAEDHNVYTVVNKHKKQCQSEVLQIKNKELIEHHLTLSSDIMDNQVKTDVSTVMNILDARLDNDAFIISPDLVQNINSNDDNHKNSRELLSFEKWDVFCSMLPSNEPRLQTSTSDKQIQLQCDSKRISKTVQESESRRSSSLMNTNDFGKTIQFELNMQNIKEIKEEDMSEPKDIVSNRNEDVIAMLQLMVQHGFYSKNALNSVEQLRKFSDFSPFHK